jgi:hypothetical protein
MKILEVLGARSEVAVHVLVIVSVVYNYTSPVEPIPF